MTIDWWTLGFQAVNVVILIWLLGHFFWKPVAAMIAERKIATQKLIDEAAKAKCKADDALADVEKTRAGFDNEREKILATAHKDAETQHAARTTQAETEAAALLTNAKATIAKNVKADTAAWADQSSNLAVAIAQRLAARLDGTVVDACFLGWLVAEIGKLPKTARDAAGAKEVKLEATSATKLDAVAQRRIVAAVGAALEGAPQITFKTDAALISGIELRGEHLTVSSSWRADLSTIRTELTPKQAA